MNHDYLSNIHTDIQIVKCQSVDNAYFYNIINNRDYICAAGTATVKTFETHNMSLLCDVLKIGAFIHESMLDKQNTYSSPLTYENDRDIFEKIATSLNLSYINGVTALQNNKLYNELIKMITAFCYKYGNYCQGKNISLDDGCIVTAMPVEIFIENASTIYRLHEIYLNTGLFSYSNNGETCINVDVKLGIQIKPKVKEKIHLQYSFNNLFDAAKYQMFLFCALPKEANTVKKCVQCGGFFMTKKNNQKYCSKYCANSASLKRKIPDIIKSCKYCNTEFVPTKQSKEYCSDKCRRKAQNERARAKK